MRQAFVLVIVCAVWLAGILPAAAQDGTHVVQPGENLFRIAQHYNLTVDTLMQANGLTDPDLVVLGQTLVIPTPRADNVAANDVMVLPLPPPLDMSFSRFVTTGGPNIHEIFRRGQALGNDPHAFSKIGDCNSDPQFFLGKFDEGKYTLGPYADLQATLDYFSGSFVRDSAAVWTGNHAWALFDPVWSNPAICNAGETPLACEFRLHRPSIVLIRLGTNEAGDSELFESSLREIVNFAIERGVIPVLGTKADRIEGSDLHNTIIRQIAEEYGVPLWDFSSAVERIPNRGLTEDGFHLNWFPLDYGDPNALLYGHPVQNLTALMMLDALRRDVIEG